MTLLEKKRTRGTAITNTTACVPPAIH